MNIGHQSNRRSVMWSETQQGILNRLAQQPLCWVQVQATRGSVPREEGAWMAVFADVGVALLVVLNSVRILGKKF